ncbi:hypothetical protein ACTHAM_001350 [Cellulomonas soli]|uniref:hypothetical protein n=1 Tax=Cellulomonas soli TaxID=931535 RepID=UPI003F8731ED
MTGAPHLSATVLVPDLPPPPVTNGEGGPLTWIFGAIAIGFAIAFVVLVIRVEFGWSTSRRPMRLVAILSGGGMVFIGASYISFQITVDGEVRARAENRALERAAEATAITGLESTYGIKFTSSSPIIPVRADDAPWEEPVTLPDGTDTTCWIDIEDGYYVLLSGGDSVETSTRLEQVNP